MFLEGSTSNPGWYVAGLGDSSVRVMGVDGRGMRVSASGYDPAWSPDGRRIAFAARLDDPERLAIYVVGATGGDPKRVVAAGEFPSWSPDGRRIAYVDPDSGAVFVINVDGTGRQRIAPGLVWDNSVEGDYTAAGYAPVWSPGGRRVAFAADLPGSRLPSTHCPALIPRQVTQGTSPAPIWQQRKSRVRCAAPPFGMLPPAPQP